MSIKEMSRIWADSKQKGSALLLLLAIADNANDDGICWPGTETLAKKTRMTTRNVLRLLDTLVDAKEISAVRRRNKGNVYVVLSGCTDSEINRRCHLLSDKTDSNVKDCHLISDTAMSHESSRTVTNPQEPASTARPNSFTVYEQNIGILTPFIADSIKAIDAECPAGWFEDAVKVAVTSNVRKMSFIEAVIARWKREGKDDGKKPSSPNAGQPSEGTPIKPKRIYR